jgi:hypothetical protein
MIIFNTQDPYSIFPLIFLLENQSVRLYQVHRELSRPIPLQPMAPTHRASNQHIHRCCGLKLLYTLVDLSRHRLTVSFPRFAKTRALVLQFLRFIR